MPQNLWTAFIESNGSNQIVVDSSPDGKNWTGGRLVNQTSPFTPAIAFFNNTLYLAFVSNDVEGGVPSNRIFVTSTADGVSWTPAVFFNQNSKCAPALTVFGNTLYLAFIANNSTNDILYCTFTEQTGWSADKQTGQSSPLSPSLVQFGPALEMVFVSNDSRNAILHSALLPAGSWGTSIDTNLSTKVAPAVAVLGSNLYVAYVAANSSNSLLLSSPSNSWTNIQLNQSSAAAPGLAAFNNGEDSLFVAFPTNNNSVECVVTSSSNPASWPTSNTNIQQSTDSGMALAVAPFACCVKMVTPSTEFGGAHNYFIWGGPCPNPPTLTNLKLSVYITSAVLSNNGFSIQWNIWSPLGSNINCVWQQYGFTVDAQGNIGYFLENWEAPNFTTVGGETLNRNIVDFRTNLYKLPTPTLPAGYLLTMQLLYVLNSPQVAGIQCTVIDDYNQVVADSGQVLLTGLHIDTKAPNPVNVPASALTPAVGFQLAVVGETTTSSDPSLSTAQFVSGAGTMVVSSPDFPLIAIPIRPTCITVQNGTGESSSCTYSVMPDAPSVLMVQTFTT